MSNTDNKKTPPYTTEHDDGSTTLTLDFSDKPKRAATSVRANEPDKAETIAILAIFGVIAAGVVGGIWADIKAEKRRAEKYKADRQRRKQLKEDLEEWINEMENQGNKVYKLSDGRYLTVDHNAQQAMHIKRLS